MSVLPSQSEPRRRSAGRESRGRVDVGRLFEQLPPHAIEAEMSLLGSILIDPQIIGDVISVVRSGDDFYKPANGALYDAMVAHYDRHSSLDIVQLNQLLVDRDLLQEVGGQDYLIELAESVPSAANATYYAQLVREKAMIRHLIGASGELLEKAYHDPGDAREILDYAEQRIFQIAERYEQTETKSFRQLLHETMELLEASEARQVTGVPTDFVDLDEITSGFQPGEMIVIAARPSMGKTALALNICEHMAMKGHPVGLFSLEMSKQALVERLLAARAGIEMPKLRRRMLSADQHRALMAACGDLQDAPIFIDDLPGLTPIQIRAKSRRMVSKFGLKAIVIDYLQLMSLGGRVESRQQEVSAISRSIKAMARELNVPVICLSQLNRGTEDRVGHRPRLSDLRESGAIEQDADVVILLHREDYYHHGDEDWTAENEDKLNVAELIVAKQRNGPTGVVKLTWIPTSACFRNFSDRHETGPSHSAYSEVKPYQRTEAPSFSPGQGTGPANNFRDGGGPERDEIMDEPPF